MGKTKRRVGARGPATEQIQKPTCRASGKFCYPKRKQALTAMHKTRAAVLRGGGRGQASDPAERSMPCAVYKCSSCRTFHMTSSPTREP